LVKEVIARVLPDKRWGASGAPAELSKALESLGLALVSDGSMRPITASGPSGITPHNVPRTPTIAGQAAAMPSTRKRHGNSKPATPVPPATPTSGPAVVSVPPSIKSIRKSLGATPVVGSASFVYFIEARYEGKPISIKIGTAKKPRNRLRALQGSCPVELRIIGCINGGPSREVEIHQQFKKERLPPIGSITNREWSFEWFESSTRLLNFIKSTLRKEGVASF
jgi:hypothetical protein